MELGVVGLVKRDPVLRDIHEEIASVRETVVHLLQRMDDEIDRRLERFGHAVLAHQPVIELRPVLDPVDQPLVVDDDEQIVVRLVALGRMRLVDPSSAGIAAVENDLENATGLLPLVLRQRKGIIEFFENQLHHALKFALLLRRQMIEFGAHYWTFSKHLEWLHPRIPAGAPAHERKRSSALFMWVSCRTIEGLCQGYAGG